MRQLEALASCGSSAHEFEVRRDAKSCKRGKVGV